MIGMMELQKLLGYTLWQNFEKVLVKAKNACENVGENVLDHFIDVNKMVAMPKMKQTSFQPHFSDKTTSVASGKPPQPKPHYLIKIKNEVMRSERHIILCFY